MFLMVSDNTSTNEINSLNVKPLSISQTADANIWFTPLQNTDTKFGLQRHSTHKLCMFDTNQSQLRPLMSLSYFMYKMYLWSLPPKFHIKHSYQQNNVTWILFVKLLIVFLYNGLFDDTLTIHNIYIYENPVYICPVHVQAMELLLLTVCIP